MNEAAFYRQLLEDIASGARRTREVRLAKSGLLFWDALREEKMRRISIEAAKENITSCGDTTFWDIMQGAPRRSKKQEELNRALDSAADAAMRRVSAYSPERRLALEKKAKNLIHPQ